MTESGFSIKDLTVGIGNKAIAKLESFSIDAGEILVLAGPNGSGKSTTIKTLARQIKPMEGTVSFQGKNIWDLDVQHFAQNIAYVPQSAEILLNITVQELVTLGRNPHQNWWSWNSSKSDKGSIAKALELTNLSQLKNAYLTELSGGEKQRAMIAVALAQDASFILLDEPTAHLDFRHQIELAHLLKELSAKGIGIFIILHDLNLIASLANKVILLNKVNDAVSEVVAYGKTEEVLQEKILSSAYQTEILKITNSENNLVVFTLKQ